MTREQKRKIEKRVLILSLAFLALAAGFLVLAGVLDFVETLWYPIGLSVILFIYWLVTDVLPMKWLNSFQGKTAAQKRAYYIYAGLDLAGVAGLIWFLVDMESTTGLAIYIASMLLKKKFKDEFDGVAAKKDAVTEKETDAENGAEAENKTGAESEAEAENRAGAESEAEAESGTEAEK